MFQIKSTSLKKPKIEIVLSDDDEDQGSAKLKPTPVEHKINIKKELVSKSDESNVIDLTESPNVSRSLSQSSEDASISVASKSLSSGQGTSYQNKTTFNDTDVIMIDISGSSGERKRSREEFSNTTEMKIKQENVLPTEVNHLCPADNKSLDPDKIVKRSNRCEVNQNESDQDKTPQLIEKSIAKAFPVLNIPEVSTKENPTTLVFEPTDKNKFFKPLVHHFVRKSRRTDNAIFTNSLQNAYIEREEWLKMKKLKDKRTSFSSRFETVLPTPKEEAMNECNMYTSSKKDYMTDDDELNFQDKETEIILMDSLDWLFSCMNPFAYPPAELVADALKRFVRQANWLNVELKANNLVNRLLRLHPPANSQMRNYYRRVFSSAAPEGYHRNRPWNFILNTIEETLNNLEIDSDWHSVNSSLRLLEYILAVLKEDLRHWDESRKTVSDLLSFQIFWGKSSNIVALNENTKKMIKLWINSHKTHHRVRNCITELFEVMLEVCWWYNLKPDALSSSYNPPSFLKSVSDELFMHFKRLRSHKICLQLVRCINSPRNRLYINTLLFMMTVPYVKNVSLETIKESLKNITVNCNNGEKSFKENDSSSSDAKNINQQNNIGETALFKACKSNNIKKIKMLLKTPGIDVNIANYDGFTPLHEAAANGRDEIISLLLKNEPHVQTSRTFLGEINCLFADVFCRGSLDETPLHNAVINNHINAAMLILKYGGGALLDLETKEQKLPIDYVKSEKMKKLLESYKGKSSGMMKVVNKYQMKCYAGHHDSLIQFIGILLDSYLEAMGVRFCRHKLIMSTQTKLNVEINDSQIKAENVDLKKMINNCKENVYMDENIEIEDSPLDSTNKKRRLSFLPNIEKCSTISTKSDRYSSEFDRSYTSVVDDMIIDRKITADLDGFKKHCKHLHYIDFVLHDR